MRLIDADKLIEDMEDTWDMQDLYLPIHFKELLIDEQPTAFNVDKVVAQLESLEPFHVDGYGDVMVNCDDVIELVKAGGV